MKFNILTIHKEPNYGACLQAYALYHALEQLGVHPRMIDLSMDYRGHEYNMKNRILLPLYRAYRGYDTCFRKAGNFSDKHTPVKTKNFYTGQQLKNFEWDPSDAYIIGSDQVWNPSITGRLSREYCLGFLPDACSKRYSYAASFGNISDESDRVARLDMPSLRRLRKVGVRERFGADFLKRQGIESTVVVDPTLLLDDYSHLLAGEVKPKKEILLLTLSDNARLAEFCRSVSSELGLPVRKLYGYLQPDRGKNRKFAGIEQWLQSIAEAEVVVTDSFHACVFAIMFRKQFLFFTEERAKLPRVENLFKQLGISGDRIVSEMKPVGSMAPIDYTEVGAKLAELRAASMDFLKQIVEDAQR